MIKEAENRINYLDMVEAAGKQKFQRKLPIL